MSGHSKWANIKVRKGTEDKKRSAVFTKMAQNIRVAVKIGGNNSDPKLNSYLKTAIDKARQVNMPKENIERILLRFRDGRQSLESFYLEGFGAGSVALIVEVETDNKIRTSNEVRLIIEKRGGNLGENNSVMFQFEKLGRIELSKITEADWEKLVEMGVWNIDGNIVEVAFEDLASISRKLTENNFEVVDSRSFLKAKIPIDVNTKVKEEVKELVACIEENEDVVAVFTNLKKND